MYNVNNRAFMAKKKIYSNPHTEAQTITISTICGQSVTSNITDLKGGGDGSWSHAQ